MTLYVVNSLTGQEVDTPEKAIELLGLNLFPVPLIEISWALEFRMGLGKWEDHRYHCKIEWIGGYPHCEINNSLDEPYRRWATAHMIGHVILHPGQSFQCRLTNCQHRIWPRDLLIPRQILYGQLKSNQYTATQLSQHYNVPRELLTEQVAVIRESHKQKEIK